eukprot:jgi/Mesvir1/12133/Mv00388-RA.1
MGLADFLCRARLNRPHLLLPESEVLDTKLAKWSLRFIGRQDLEAQYQEYRGSIHFRRLARALIWLIIFCFIAISFAFTGLAEETCASSIMGITMGFFVAFIVVTFGVLLATDKWPHKLDPMTPVVAIICILMVLNMVYLRLDVECSSSRFANLFGNRVEDALIYFTFTTMSIMYFIHCMFSIRYIHSLLMVGMFVILFFAWPVLGGSSFYGNISQMRRVEWPRAVQHMAYSCVGCVFLALNRERSERKHFLLKTAFAQGYNGGNGGGDGSNAGGHRVYWSMEPQSAKKDESRRRQPKSDTNSLRKFSLPVEDNLLDIDTDTSPEPSNVTLETPLEAAIGLVDGMLNGSCPPSQRTLRQLRELLDADNLNMPLLLERLRAHGVPARHGAYQSSTIGRISRQTSVPTGSSAGGGKLARGGRLSESSIPGDGGPWGMSIDTRPLGSPGPGNSPAMITPGEHERKGSWDGTAAWDAFLDPEGLSWLADALSKPCVDELEDHMEEPGRHLKGGICNLMGVVMNESSVEPLVLGKGELRLADSKGEGLVFDAIESPSSMAEGMLSPVVNSPVPLMESAVLGSVSGDSSSSSSSQWTLPPLLHSLAGGRMAVVNQLLATTLGRWEFNAHELQSLTGGKALAVVVYEIIRNERLVHKLGLDLRRLQGFLLALNAGFNERNAYHNGTHAAEVANSFYCLLRWSGVRELLDDVDVLAGLLASAMLEFRHPGRTNDSLVRTRHKLAVLYNDQSVTQNHAVASAWQLMLDDPSGCDCVAGFPPHQATRVRSLVLDLVLATDLATQHFEVLRRFKRRFLCGDCRQGCSKTGRHACYLSSPAVLEAVKRQRENPLKGKGGGRSQRPSKGRFSDHGEGAVGGGSPREEVASVSMAPEGQPHRLRLCFKDRRLLLMMALKCADVGHLAKIGPLHRKWAIQQHSELQRQGQLEHGLGLKPSPFSDPTTNDPTQQGASLYNHLDDDFQQPSPQQPHPYSQRKDGVGTGAPSAAAGHTHSLPHPPPGSPTPHWRTPGPILPAPQLPPLALDTAFPPSVKVSTNPMYHHTRTLSDSDSVLSGSLVASPYASRASHDGVVPPSGDILSGSGNDSTSSLPPELNLHSATAAPSVSETASLAAGTGTGSVIVSPPSPTPPLSTSLARFQMSFFAFVGLPLFKAWSAAFEAHESTSGREVMDNLMDNYNTWLRLVEVSAAHDGAHAGQPQGNRRVSLETHHGSMTMHHGGNNVALGGPPGGLIDHPAAHVMGRIHVPASSSSKSQHSSLHSIHPEIKDLLETAHSRDGSENGHGNGHALTGDRSSSSPFDAPFLVPGATMSNTEGDHSALSSPTYTPRGAAYQRSLSSVKIMMSLSRPGTPRQVPLPGPPQAPGYTPLPPQAHSPTQPPAPPPPLSHRGATRSEGSRLMPAVPLSLDTTALPGPKGSITPIPDASSLYMHGTPNGIYPAALPPHLRLRTTGGATASADLGSPTGYFDGKASGAPGWVPARGPYAAVEGDDALSVEDSNRNEEDSPLAAFSERSVSSWVDALPGSGTGRHRKASSSGGNGAGGSNGAPVSEAKPGGRHGGTGALSKIRNKLSKLPSADKRKGLGMVSAPSEASLVQDNNGERPQDSSVALDDMENGDLGRMA